jgi:hypothetical protein
LEPDAGGNLGAMSTTDKRPASTRPAPTQPDPVDRQPEGDPERFTYHDADREQADFEGLLEEKDDFQEAVDADRRGEEPTRSGGSTMP